MPSGVYSSKDVSGLVYTMSGHERTLQIKYDDISLKTNFKKMIITKKIFNGETLTFTLQLIKT